ncbi:hypothetical protein EDB81DRAFT_634060 [Dactylonectria macrodidyma]|uniref:Ankyrin n=1 Tax=Dactylonectria macrodidyma TaxID=307937 RepID=A0A9P9JMS4_9HYPO|nr:hypothetical protein EDB81DRAFT_634060 [Dactylonectria macrodidyma]
MQAQARLLGGQRGSIARNLAPHGRTPLSYAVGMGHETIVKLLLDTGNVDIDWKDRWSRTSLSYAAEIGHEAMVKLLLDTGNVDVNSKVTEQRKRGCVCVCI